MIDKAGGNKSEDDDNESARESSIDPSLSYCTMTLLLYIYFIM